MKVNRSARAAPAAIEKRLNGITGTSLIPSSRVAPPASAICSSRSKRSRLMNR